VRARPDLFFDDGIGSALGKSLLCLSTAQPAVGRDSELGEDPINRHLRCRAGADMDCAPKKGSAVGSVAATVREVRLPVGIHLLTLLIEVARGRELIFVHLRGSVHDAFGGVEHE
jgi:hypothetical protein